MAVPFTTRVVSANGNWIISEEGIGTGVLRSTANDTRAADADFPRFLDPSALKVVSQVEATESPTAVVRRAAAPAPLKLNVTAEAAGAYVAVARHPSGKITFHFPQQDGQIMPPSSEPSRGTRRGKPATFPLKSMLFVIPVGTVARIENANASRGIISRLIKVVIMKAVDFIVDKTLPLLGAQLEKKLWRDANRVEGWVRVIDLSLASGAIEPIVPNLSGNERGLLCIHGSFSHTVSAFKEFLHGQTLQTLRTTYGAHIYGFDHFTISKDPKSNVSDMLNALPNGPAMTFDVITHSRGGLVLRTLLSELLRAGNGKLKIGRVILVAAPNQGTPLATPSRWEQTLGWFANLMDMFPDNPFTTAASWISGSLSWLAQKATGDLPGLSSMDMDGAVVASLESTDLPIGIEWYSMVANYQPTDSNLIVRLADMSVDGFFQGANDLVVPSEGGWQLGTIASAFIAPERIGCFGVGGNLLVDQPGLVNHVTFFTRPETHHFLNQALAGQPISLPLLTTTALLPVRGLLSEPAITLPPANTIAATSVGSPVTPAVEAIVQRAWAAENAGRQPHDCLQLIVLPLPTRSSEKVSPVPASTDSVHPSPDQQSEEMMDAQLLATYSGAYVLAPFHLRGRADGAGDRWKKIIAGHKDINSFVEGTLKRNLRVRDIETLGAALFDTLFRRQVRRLYDQARFRHDRRKLNVVFTSMIPWVADLPWEFAFDDSCSAFLATSDVRFVRNVLTCVPADAVPSRPAPLRILVVSAQPRSAAALSLDEERALIEKSFRPLIRAGAVQVDILPEATPDQLHARMRQGEGKFDIVHFMGHGRFDPKSATGYLIFEDSKRNVQELSTSHVTDILRSRGIKLVFLNACETGRGGRADYNKGVAPGLVAGGVPTVVANQYSVLDRSATTFAQHFYWCLAQGLTVGDAAREARIALNYSGGGLIGWGVPVLFARDPEAVLCDGIIRDDTETYLPISTTVPAIPDAVYTPPTSVGADIYSWSSTADLGGLPPSLVANRSLSPLTSTIKESSAAQRVVSVAVWDVNDGIPGLDRIVTEMNNCQHMIEFQLANLTAPYGIWKADDRFDTVAYLPAERTARRLRKLAASTGADYLLCVTDLPLSGNSTTNIYLWTGSENAKQKNRVIIFSTWGFSPVLCGTHLRNALANVAVSSLFILLANPTPADQSRGTIFFYNANREVSHLAGHQKIGDANREPLRESLLKKRYPAELYDALQSLLDLFHPGEAAPTTNTLSSIAAPAKVSPTDQASKAKRSKAPHAGKRNSRRSRKA